MALDSLNGKIKVYNYEMSPVGFPSQHNIQGVFIRGRDEEESFVVERVALDDIESENTKSDLFRVGRLRFDPKEEDEVYKLLGIEDKSNIKTDKELSAILQDDSIENIKWISSLKSSTLLSRMKTLLFNMERNGLHLPQTIVSVVTERNSELKNGGKRHENSEINRILEAEKKKNEENKLHSIVEQLSKEVESLKKEKEEKDKTLQDSQVAIQDLLKMVNDLKNTTPAPAASPKRSNSTAKRTSANSKKE
ncbi:hypothetical protein [uncultured Metabacillus sp.]|uniref:hypothetical protein n=1 Tax=uncultured Metabacillus sp. TaxID=2860135 RepID=UPI0026288EA4|nr:hypothetical protein [uncultured Metabacillus sp.]